MTVIAWDGTTLAADRMCSIGGTRFEVTKIRQQDGVLFALAGDGTRLEQLLSWHRDGADPAKYPTRPADNDSVLVAIDRHAGKIRVRRFEGTGYPILLEGRFYADGIGRDVALAAMHCGRSAVDAVVLANELIAYCGLGVDSLTLELPAAPDHTPTEV